LIGWRSILCSFIDRGSTRLVRAARLCKTRLPSFVAATSPSQARAAHYGKTRITAVVLLTVVCSAFTACSKPITGNLDPDAITAEPLTPEQRMRQYNILPPPPADANPALQTLPYRPVAEKYNAWTRQLKTLWTRVDAVIQYQDAQGNLKREDAEGYLIARPPNRIALSLGKLGQTGLWVGRNDARYWLFELHESDTAYVGDVKNLGRPCSRSVNWAIQPADLPLVLGWLPVPVDGLARQPRVRMQQGYATFMVPRTRLRYWVDPNTGRPVRIDVVNPAGEAELVCLLRKPVSLEGNTDVQVPSQIDGVWIATGERLRLNLKAPTDGRGGQRVADALFEFDALLEELKPDKVVVLDEGCE